MAAAWLRQCQLDWRIDGVGNMVVWTVMSYLTSQTCGKTPACRSWREALKWGFVATVLSIGLTCLKANITMPAGAARHTQRV